MTSMKTTRAGLFAAAFAGALLPAAAEAQHAESDEIIVTAPIEGSRIESLQGAAILSRDEIVESLNGGLGDTLDAQPGIATTFFGAGASRPIIRGLGEDRVRVLQNGIGAIDASTASPDHAVTSDGLDSERIEVLRGAAALAYGGNAIGGVVNVIDQSIPTRAIDGWAGNGFASYSSVDEGRQAALEAGFGLGGVSIRANASARETEDYDTPVGAADNSWTSMRTLGLGAALNGEWGFAGVAVKRLTDDYGLPPEAPGEPGGFIEMEQTRIESRGDLSISTGPFTRLDYGVQHSEYEHTEFEGDGAAGTRFTSEGWEGRVEAHHRGERLRGAVGAQFSDVDFGAQGDEAFITPSNTRDTGVFIVERWDNQSWGLEGGARLERREVENVNAGSRTFDNTSVSLGAFARPSPGWFLGATIGRTERAPTAMELFSDGPHLATANYEIGDPALDQETALSLEASARYATETLRFEANVFRVEFSDYIALVENGDEWWFDEATDDSDFVSIRPAPLGAETLPVFAFVQQDATFTGGELSVDAQLFEAAGFAFSGNAAVDVVRAEFDAGGRPPRIPPATLTLGLRGDNERWSGRIEVVHTAEQDRIAAFETTTDSFTFLNAGLAYRPFGEERDVVIRLDGRNLTDELGRVHASFLKDELPLPGRNVRLAVTTSF